MKLELGQDSMESKKETQEATNPHDGTSPPKEETVQDFRPIKRRRRRRPNPQSSNPSPHHPQQQNIQLFSHGGEDFLKREQQQNRRTIRQQRVSLVNLLNEREAGFSASTNSYPTTARLGTRWNWQRRMVYPPSTKAHQESNIDENNNDKQLYHKPTSCRSWIEQKIPFTALETPLSVAVLALEKNTGAFALGLAQHSSCSTSSNTQHSMVSPTLALHIYGLPSHNSFAQKRRMPVPGFSRNRHSKTPRLVAPKLSTIPLAWDDEDNHEETLEELYGQKLDHHCVDLCISRDWRMGLAVVKMPQTPLVRAMAQQQHRLESNTTTTRMASLVLFPLAPPLANPFDQQQEETFPMNHPSVFRAVHVPISSMFGMRNEGRNLLWKVSRIPHCERTSSKWTIHSAYKEIPSYLLLIDDAEGYRLTWIAEYSWQLQLLNLHGPDHKEIVLDPVMMGSTAAKKPSWKKSSRPILVPISTSDPPYWKQRSFDRQSGAARLDDEFDDEFDDDASQNDVKSTKVDPPQIRIVQEGQLLILSLLSDLLERRPSLRPFSKQHSRQGAASFDIPDYAYELVSISHGGRVAKVVLGFPSAANEKQSIDKSNTTTRTQPVPQKHYVAVLVALDLWTERYCELQWVKSPVTTPASTSSSSSPSSLAKHMEKLAIDFRKHELTGLHKTNKKDHSNSTESHIVRREDAAATPLSMMYPDCDVVSNRNVLRGLPVMSISSRSPVELIYG